MQRGVLLISCSFIALILLSCNSEQREKISQLFDRSSEQKNNKEIRSTDDCCSIHVPSSWKEEKDLNDQANIQAANRLKELYIIVLSEAKGDFENMTLENHSKLTRTEFIKSLTGSQVTGPVSVTVDKNPGTQYEISGAVNNTKIVALHTTVESTKHFHQILAWTIHSRAAANKPILQSVIQTFKEAPPAAAKKNRHETRAE